MTWENEITPCSKHALPPPIVCIGGSHQGCWWNVEGAHLQSMGTRGHNSRAQQSRPVNKKQGARLDNV